MTIWVTIKVVRLNYSVLTRYYKLVIVIIIHEHYTKQAQPVFILRLYVWIPPTRKFKTRLRKTGVEKNYLFRQKKNGMDH